MGEEVQKPDHIEITTDFDLNLNFSQDSQHLETNRRLYIILIVLLLRFLH